MSRNLAARITLSVRDRATAPLRAVKRQFTGLRGVITSVGTAFATYFSARAIGSFFSSTVREASLLETGLARVGAVTQGTGEEMDRLKAKALEMGGSTRYSAAEAAGAMESLARSGLNTTETIQALPSVLALAEGQSIGLAEAAQLTTRAANGMGIEFSEAARITDVLTAAASNADTDVTQLGEALGYAAPTARAAGLALEDTVAIIGKLSDAGIDGSRAGTALNTVLAQFMDTGSKFSAELADLGINTDNFVEALVQLEAAGGDAEAAINAAGLQAGPALRSLLAQGTDSLIDLGNTARNSMGDAEAAAKRMDDTLEGALENLRSGWRRVKIFLGEPLLDRIAEEARNLAGRLQDLVNSGHLDRLRDLIVETFDQGMEAVHRFFDGLGNTDEVVGKFTDKFAVATGFVRRFGDAATLVGHTVVAAFQTVNTVVSGVLAVIVGAVASLHSSLNTLVQGLNRVGLATDAFAFRTQNAQQALDEMAVALKDRTAEAAKQAADSTNTAADALERLATGNYGVQESAEDAADAMDREGRAAEDAADQVVEANDRAADSYGDVGDAAEESGRRARESLTEQEEKIHDHRENLRALRTEYREALEAGATMQELGGVLREITKEQRGLRAATRDTAKAFEELGLTTQEDLDETARKGREAFEAIRNSGTASAQQVQKAFEVYAQRAVEANGGVVDATLKAQGAQIGLRTEVDESGKVIVRSAREAAEATRKAGDEAQRLGGEWRKAGDEAEAAGKKMEETSSKTPDFEDRGYNGRAAGAYNVEASTDTAMLEELLAMERNSLKNSIGSKYAATRQANQRNIERIERRLQELADEEEQQKLERLRRQEQIQEIQRGTRQKEEKALDLEKRRGGVGVDHSTPTKTVRIELGGATIDVPEDQGERFLRELERHQARTG